MTVVAAVCVNYRSAHHIARMLESIESFELSEILILDNFSGTEEVERLVAVCTDHPLVRLLFSSQNVGFGAGVNRLVKSLHHETDYVWVINPDITAEPGTLEKLISSAEQNHCEIISPLILSDDGQRIWYSGGDLDLAGGRSVHVNIGKQITRRPSGFRSVSFMTGAAPLISMRAWQSLGGFDERLFLYCEDADFSIRANKRGLSMGIELGAVVNHAEGGSSGGSARGPSAIFYYFVQRNRLYVYGAGRSKFSVLFGAGILETIRLVVFPWRPLDGRAPKRFLWSLLGIVAGLRGEEGPGMLGGRVR